MKIHSLVWLYWKTREGRFLSSCWVCVSMCVNKREEKTWQVHHHLQKHKPQCLSAWGRSDACWKLQTDGTNAFAGNLHTDSFLYALFNKVDNQYTRKGQKLHHVYMYSVTIPILTCFPSSDAMQFMVDKMRLWQCCRLVQRIRCDRCTRSADIKCKRSWCLSLGWNPLVAGNTGWEPMSSEL